MIGRAASARRRTGSRDAARARPGPNCAETRLVAVAPPPGLGKTDQVTEPRPAPLSQAIVTLLKPLVRLVLKRGMAFGQFSELVKRAYVEVAQQDFAVPGRRLTISRIAVLTGLTRKEAKRVLESDPEDASAVSRRRINRAARVVSAWARDPDYFDGRGAPGSLPFEDPGGGPSFSTLVREHGADVTPRAVLDELVRVGAVEHLKDGRIRLVERAYIPQADESEKLAILGSDVADLIASIEHNLEPDLDARGGRPFFQRKVAYDNLPRAYLEELQQRVRERAQQLLEELNDEMASHDLDVSPPAARGGDENDRGGSRAMVGIYYFQEEASDEEGQDDEDDA